MNDWTAATEALVENGTATEKPPKDPFSKDSGLQTDLAVSGVFYMCAIVIPNTLVVIVLLFGKKSRQPSDWLVLNLSATHSVVAFFTGPIALVKYFRGVYPGGQDVCKLQAFFSLLGVGVNLLLVTSMTIERYLALSKPFFYRRYIKDSPRTVFAGLLVIWASTIAYTLLPVLGVAGTLRLTSSFCNPDWRKSSADSRAFVSLSLIVLFLCAMVIVVCNIGAILSLWRMDKVMRRASSLSISLTTVKGSRSNSRRESLVSLLSSSRRCSLESVGGRAKGITTNSVRGLSAVHLSSNSVQNTRPKFSRRRSSLSTVMESSTDKQLWTTSNVTTASALSGRSQLLSTRRRMSLPAIGTKTPQLTRGIDGQLMPLELSSFHKTPGSPLEEELPPEIGQRDRLPNSSLSALPSVDTWSNRTRRRSSSQVERRRRNSRWRRPRLQGDAQCTRMIVCVTLFFVACITPHAVGVQFIVLLF